MWRKTLRLAMAEASLRRERSISSIWEKLFFLGDLRLQQVESKCTLEVTAEQPFEPFCVLRENCQNILEY